MSGTDTQSDFTSEYEEAKNTARAYLLALGVLQPIKKKSMPLRPTKTISMPEFRERQTKKIEDMFLKGGKVVVDLPDDPDVREAGMLAYRFLHDGHNPKILDTLLANEGTPAYRMVLEVLQRCMPATGSGMPEQLRVWEAESNSKAKRWRRQPTRNHLIGMVVEALVIGNDTLNRWAKSERKQERLQREREQFQGDYMEAIREAVAKPLEEFSNKDVIESLHKMRARPWRKKNGGKGLTEYDLVELTNQQPLKPAGIEAIVPKIKVRKHFPNLYAMRNDATKDKGFDYSICDAVAEVLTEERQRGGYRTVQRAWMAYRNLRSPTEN